MVPEWQYVAIAVFLAWGLLSSLCDLVVHRGDEADLIEHRPGPGD